MNGPPLRRVFMTADAVGGVWTYVADLTAGLAERGVNTTLAVLGPAPSAAQARMLDPDGVEVIATGLTLDWLESQPHGLRRTAARVADLARASGADLIHLNSPALAAGQRFDVPVVGACHSCLATWWEAVRGGEMPESFRWRTDALARGYAACDVLVAPSRAFADATQTRYGVRVAPVRNGRVGRPGAGTADKEPFVFTSGRLWDDGKNLAALDAAGAHMAGRVVAAGALEGPGGAAAGAQRVELLGTLSADEHGRWLDRAAVFASLALYEPFGLGVLEAAQARCALVLSDIPTFRELWDGAAIFVDPSDPVGVARTLDGMLGRPAEVARLGAAAADRAADYTAAAMTEGALAVYRQALQTAARRIEAAA